MSTSSWCSAQATGPQGIANEGAHCRRSPIRFRILTGHGDLCDWQERRGRSDWAGAVTGAPVLRNILLEVQTGMPCFPIEQWEYSEIHCYETQSRVYVQILFGWVTSLTIFSPWTRIWYT